VPRNVFVTKLIASAMAISAPRAQRIAFRESNRHAASTTSMQLTKPRIFPRMLSGPHSRRKFGRMALSGGGLAPGSARTIGSGAPIIASTMKRERKTNARKPNTSWIRPRVVGSASSP
jgi:hypothetical protein